MRLQIGQWGNSLAVRIPKYVADALALKANNSLALSVEDGKIVLEPVQDLPNLSLDEWLAQVSEPPESEVN